MKKILILNTTMTKGGAARIARDLFENLGNDFDMHFAFGRGVKDSSNKTFYFGNKLETCLQGFLVRVLGLEGFGSYFSTKKLIRYMQKEKFDLINMHNLHGYYLNFFMLLDFLKKSNIPIVYSLHDEWPITWLPAHSMGCKHCKTGTGRCTNTYTYPKNYLPFFTNYMLRRKKLAFSKTNMTIVCPSIWLTNSIKQSFLGTFKIETAHNAIDTEIFKPARDKNTLKIKHGLPLDKKIILFSASNFQDRSKGINYIIDAAKLLKDKKYLFLGIGKGFIKPQTNVRTLSYIYDKEKLAEIYGLSDIFCFASKAETFLLSAAEALACGTPVVGFDIPVVRELVNQKVGVLTKANEISLAHAIDHLLSDQSARIEMGSAGRRLLLNTYSTDIFYSNYKNTYTEQINNL